MLDGAVQGPRRVVSLPPGGAIRAIPPGIDLIGRQPPGPGHARLRRGAKIDGSLGDWLGYKGNWDVEALIKAGADLFKFIEPDTPTFATQGFAAGAVRRYSVYESGTGSTTNLSRTVLPSRKDTCWLTRLSMRGILQAGTGSVGLSCAVLLVDDTGGQTLALADASDGVTQLGGVTHLTTKFWTPPGFGFLAIWRIQGTTPSFDYEGGASIYQYPAGMFLECF